MLLPTSAPNTESLLVCMIVEKGCGLLFSPALAVFTPTQAWAKVCSPSILLVETSASWKGIASDCVTVSVFVSLKHVFQSIWECLSETPAPAAFCVARGLVCAHSAEACVSSLLGRLLIFKDEPATGRI